MPILHLRYHGAHLVESRDIQAGLDKLQVIEVEEGAILMAEVSPAYATEALKFIPVEKFVERGPEEIPNVRMAQNPVQESQSWWGTSSVVARVFDDVSAHRTCGCSIVGIALDPCIETAGVVGGGARRMSAGHTTRVNLCYAYWAVHRLVQEIVFGSSEMVSNRAIGIALT